MVTRISKSKKIEAQSTFAEISKFGNAARPQRCAVSQKRFISSHAARVLTIPGMRA
jgi:hypothetical protein